MKWRLALLLAGTACLAGLPASTAAQTRQRDVLTRDEILASGQKDRGDLLQIIRSLRPHFLAPPRGVRSMVNGGPAPVQFYVDDLHRPMSDLKFIKPEEVEEVRYLEPNRAQDQYGITHSGGAVVVKLRGPKSGKP